jgi:hypothetical protein
MPALINLGPMKTFWLGRGPANFTWYKKFHYKNTDHQPMHKESFIINRNTLLHVSTLLGNLQGELFCYRYTKVAFYS